MTSSTSGTVTTYTAAAPAPSGLDPASGVTNVVVAAASAEAAILDVTVTPPSGSGADSAAYKALFNITATAVEGGYNVMINGIKEEKVEEVEAAAIAALTDSTVTTITIPAGLYYRITPSADLENWGTAVSGLSTGSVDAPTITGENLTKGFYKVELNAKPIE